MKITIRQATEKDISLLFELICELATYEKLRDQVTATEDLLRKSLFGKDSYAEVLIGEIDGSPEGFALFFHNYSTFLGKPGLYLEDLYVREAQRGKGLGLALFKRLAQISIERDCGRFEWSVLDWNESAIKFYEKSGAKMMKEWVHFRIDGESLSRLGG